MSYTTRSIYHGKVIDLHLDSVQLPNGYCCELEIIRHPGGAAVVATDDKDRVCLLRQYRHAAESWLWELPAGKLECGEQPLATAQRELAEEAGVTARDWSSLGAIWSSPGVFAEEISLFFARGLEHIGAKTDMDELIEIHWLPWAKAMNMALDGTIRDAKTLIGLFRADAARTSP